MVFRSKNRDRCLEIALALHVAGIESEVRSETHDFGVWVKSLDAQRSRVELDAYTVENPEAPSARVIVHQPAHTWIGPLCYAITLVLMAWLEHRREFGIDWLEAGKTHALGIRQGQWWRTVTALTLHADSLHLLANLMLGGVFGLLASQSLGVGVAWLGILVAGSLGNALNAWIRPPQHSSIGASTAVFAALGILAAQAWRRNRWQTSWMQRWAPIIGGVLLLAYLGTGGERTDVAAHVCGFACGAGLGSLLGTLRQRVLLARSAQWICGAVALALLATAWIIAL